MSNMTYTVNGEVMSPLEYVDYLHRQLAGETLRANQGWARADAKSKECIELRERMAAAFDQKPEAYLITFALVRRRMYQLPA